MNFETIRYDVDPVTHVASIALNRPAQLNALDLQMSHDLLRATIAADEDPGVRCVVLSGIGKAFSAGGDLASMNDAEGTRAALLKEMATNFHAAISRIARMDAPVIAKVHGAAAGAGFSMALACDVVLAASSATFTMAYTRVGLTPDGSSTWFLPRVVGLRRAVELVLTNRVLSAVDAHDWGIVTRVVDDEILDHEVHALASSLAVGPTGAFGGAKRLFQASGDNGLETQMELETREIAAQSMTPDGCEGIASYLQKRAAEFTGS